MENKQTNKENTNWNYKPKNISAYIYIYYIIVSICPCCLGVNRSVLSVPILVRSSWHIIALPPARLNMLQAAAVTCRHRAVLVGTRNMRTGMSSGSVHHEGFVHASRASSQA